MPSAIVMPVARLNGVSLVFAHSARGSITATDGRACVVRRRVPGRGRLLVLLVLLVLRATTMFRCHEGSCYTAEDTQRTCRDGGRYNRPGSHESLRAAPAAAAPVHPGRHRNGRDPRGHHGGRLYR